MAKCLVLGANGFIGSHLVDALVAAGQEVRAFDRFGKSRPRFLDSPRIEVYKGDFLNRADLERAVRGSDYVFHFISTTTPATAENDPLIDVDTNIKMSINLFEECAKQQVKKLIFASTGGAIYGSTTGEPIPETTLPLPVSPYAIGKLTIEHYLRYFKVKHGLDSVVLRISNPYGERQPLHRKQGVIPIFLENIINGRPLTVFDDGSMVRDYVYVKDVAAMVASMFDQPAKYDVYNLGSGTGTSINELVKAVEAVSGKSAELVHKPVPPTFVHKIVLDTSRFSAEFGPASLTGLDEGLAKTLQYVKTELNERHEK